MIAERRQYVIFRLSILSVAALFVVGVAIATHQLYPVAINSFSPARLSCGCAIVTQTNPWWLTLAAWIMMVAVASIIGTIVVNLIIRFRRSSRLQQRFKTAALHQAMIQGKSLDYRCVEDADPVALTIGWFHPNIVITSSLLRQLTPAELEAVLLHERAHQRAYDPFMTDAISVIMTLFRWVPGSRHVLAAMYSYREIAADAVATNAYQSTQALASAFIKLSEGNIHPAWSAFSPNADRLEKLLDRGWTSPQRWWSVRGLVLAAAVYGAVLSLGHVASAKHQDGAPAAAAACRETIVMCQRPIPPVFSADTYCAGGFCGTTELFHSSLYAITPAK